MKVLVIGSGGREHTLAWKLNQSERVKNVFCAPGNAGMAQIGDCFDVAAEDITGQLRLARKLKTDLVVVGPEIPLANGIVDTISKEKIPIFGPVQSCARLEGSKVFAKEFFQEFNIPTADFDVCTSASDALQSAEKRNGRCAIKADGLAAGKGVVVCKDMPEAKEAIDRILVQKEFGRAGYRVVVEDLLEGEEASIMAICDGDNFIVLESSQDHKALNENDTGPNTGGMGAYSPAPIVTPEIESRVVMNIIQPAINGMNQMGTPFRGVLYAGIMIENGQPKTLEFNVRFGDPETQPVLLRLKTDLVDILEAAIFGKLDKLNPVEWHSGASVCVVLASGGYPRVYKKGLPITGLEALDLNSELMVFHAGTKMDMGMLITSGGRVLGVTALGDSISDAQDRAYSAVEKIRFDDVYYRKDIAWRALERE